MRPRLSHWCRHIFGIAGLLRATAILYLAFGFWQPVRGAAGKSRGALGRMDSSLSIEQVRDAASLALPRSESRVDANLLKVTRRPDLEYLLSTIVQRRGSQGLYLYQVEMPSQASYDGQWTVDQRRRGPVEAYELYSFESMEKRADVGAESQSLRIGTWPLSLSKSELANFAAFFLETTVPFRPGEIVLDQDALRDSVGRHYFTAYDEAWRSIDAYSRLWHVFFRCRNRVRSWRLEPKSNRDGRYRGSR